MTFKDSNHLDFLNIKTTLTYLTILLLIILSSSIIHDICPLLLTASIIFFTLKKNFFKCIEIWIILLFTSGFFIGQGYINFSFVSKYIAKPSFVLFCIFIYYLPSVIKTHRNSKLLISIIILSLLTLISSLIHNQSPFTFISLTSFFTLYLLIENCHITIPNKNKLLNLFIAAAILQTIVSFLQIGQIIAPPTTTMDDGSGGSFLWEAGLDDAACGTFGPVSGHLVSWYASLIALICLILWGLLKKIKYAFIAILSLIQFLTVDSKTVMGVMIVMMLYLIFYHFVKFKKYFNIRFDRLILIFTLSGIVGFGFLKGLNTYYEYYSSKTESDNRSDLNSVYDSEIKESKDVVLKNIGDWGKIQGFRYVYNDFMEEGITELLFGYGMQGFDFNTKSGYILSKDTPIMKKNNSTNSNSGLINHFATLGILGSIFLFLSIYFWYKSIIKPNNINSLFFVRNSITKIYIIFTIICSFIYPVTFYTLPVISFGGILGILKNNSEK